LWEATEKHVANHGNEQVIALWKTVAHNEKQIPWARFSEVFWAEMKISNPEQNSRSACVKQLLEVSQTEPIVTKAHYDNFTTLFSPFRSGDEGTQYIDSIVSLCKQNYFYGLQGRTDAEAVINIVRNTGKNPTPYLLRISTTLGVQFCLSYYPPKSVDKKIVHLPIAPSAYLEKGIEAYVKTFEHTYKVKSVDNVSRNLYRLIFTTDNTPLLVEQTAGTQAYTGQASGLSMSGVKTIDG